MIPSTARTYGSRPASKGDGDGKVDNMLQRRLEQRRMASLEGRRCRSGLVRLARTTLHPERNLSQCAMFQRGNAPFCSAIMCVILLYSAKIGSVQGPVVKKSSGRNVAILGKACSAFSSRSTDNSALDTRLALSFTCTNSRIRES